MFKKIQLRLQDMKTISRLITGADEQASMLGEEEPGAEHFVLSACELPDGTAKRVFERIGSDPAKFIDAINMQYSDALNTVGISPSAIEPFPGPIETKKTFRNSKPSGQAVMKLLHALKQQDKDRPLLGAHVISVVAEMEYGIAPRAFKAMEITRDQLVQAAKEELKIAHG